jgi:predicted nucleic acid-binding Zn ribbon protein
LTRRSPRPLGPALEALLERIAPASTLAAVQAVWASAAGPAVEAHGTPVGERDGVLTVACDEAVWANEIDLMGPDLVAAINAAMGREALRALTCRAGSPPGSSRRRRRKQK